MHYWMRPEKAARNGKKNMVNNLSNQNKRKKKKKKSRLQGQEPNNKDGMLVIRTEHPLLICCSRLVMSPFLLHSTTARMRENKKETDKNRRSAVIFIWYPLECHIFFLRSLKCNKFEKSIT